MTRSTIGEKEGWHFERGNRYVRQVAEGELLVVERQKDGWMWRYLRGQRQRARGGYCDSARAAQAAADAYWNERA